MAKSIEDIAAKSIGYLKRTDALTSHDYEPEIKAEFVRVLTAMRRETVMECAKFALDKITDPYDAAFVAKDIRALVQKEPRDG